MVHTMIDLETLGVRPTATILSVGACTFRTDGEPSKIFRRFYRVVAWSATSRTISSSTVAWWLSQSDERRKEILRADAFALEDVLEDFVEWYPRGKGRIWSNGANFDIPILENALVQYNLKRPWHFRDIRDCRTIFELGSYFNIEPPEEARSHHALHDALWQADYVMKIYRSLKRKDA